MIFRRNHIKDGVEYSKPNSYSYILNGKERCEKLMPEDKSRKSKLVRKSFPFVCQKFVCLARVQRFISNSFVSMVLK